MARFEVARKRLANLLWKQNPTPAASQLITTLDETMGVGQDWTPEAYGNYYARSSLVYSAVRTRAEAVVRPRLRVMQGKTPDDAVELDTNHPYVQLMARVNPFWTRSDLWRATSINLDLWGSMFWNIERGPGNLPIALWPIRPDRVTIMASKREYIRGFMVADETGDKVAVLPEDMVWFRHYNPLAELAGFAPMAAARLSADSAIDASKHNRDIFKRGVLGSHLFVKFPGEVDQEELRLFQRALEQRYAGSENSHRPIVASGDVDMKNFGMTQKDMDFMAGLRWDLEDVCRVFNVPKILLGDLERATYSNIDAAERIFWRNSIVPLLMFLSEEVNEMLSPMFGPNIFIDFDLGDIESLQPNVREIESSQRQDVAQGIMTVNEVREARGLDPVPWGDEPTPTSGYGAEPVEAGMPRSVRRNATAPMVSDVVQNGYKRWHAHEASDEYLDTFGNIIVKQMDAGTEKFKEVMDDLFNRQMKETIRNFRTKKSYTKQPPDEGSVPFSPGVWRQAFQKIGTPIYRQLLLQSANSQISQFGLGISFDITTLVTQQWLADRVALWADLVNEETGRLVTQEIEEGVALGQSIPQIEGRLMKVFDFSKGVRSERIARTETLSAINQGAQEAYEQSNVVERKMWIATMDGRVREFHAEAHRQVVPLESTFLVGGQQLSHPGAIGGSPANVINCRCTMVPVITEKALLPIV